MNNKYEVRKRFAILGWVFVSSIFLWLSSIIPNAFELGSFLNYVLLLYGGGFSFHFLTELLAAPASEGNWGQWGSLVKCLTYAAFIILGVFGIAYFEKYIYSFGGFITLVAIFPGVWFTVTQAEKAHTILASIKNG